MTPAPICPHCGPQPIWSGPLGCPVCGLGLISVTDDRSARELARELARKHEIFDLLGRAVDKSMGLESRVADLTAQRAILIACTLFITTLTIAEGVIRWMTP